MKIGNFGSFDEELKKRGIVGLSNVSRLDKEIWEEFHNNWEKLSFESEMLISQFKGENIENIFDNEQSLIEGKDKLSLVKTRVNQNFFRQTILSAYNETCCITQIKIPSLLVASHIIPWSKDIKNRLNPHNGLCLNSIHDKAFDLGYMTVTTEYKAIFSKKLNDFSNDIAVKEFFLKYENKAIDLPDRFLPDIEFLKYHYDNIFIK